LEALQAHPLLNVNVDPDGRVVHQTRQHLGVAFDTPRGPLVPVLRDAGALNFLGLARLLTQLAERVQAGDIGQDELTGGTFTLTNPGERGVLFDIPILNPPQVGTLGAGTLVERPVVVRNADHQPVIAIRSMAYFALTYDNRLVESAGAARFLATVKARLESGQFVADHDILVGLGRST
jgi:2-oxoglutarate dehydrogenase E2 component (dihydrolipoamide succinyltransferase)